MLLRRRKRGTVGAAPKPPYRVPSMRDVRARPPNGLVVASTFSGCGGSSLGFRMAGFRVAWSNEFVEEARRTYGANADPRTVVDGRDVRTVKPEEILAAAGGAGTIDVLEGSPPCASFSTAGSRERGWGKVKRYSDVEQRTDDLFFEFVRLLGGVRPRAFVAENVAGLVMGAAKGYFLEILRALEGCGYDVAVRLLDAQWLGVPQQRTRVIFVGIRRDLGTPPAHPRPLPYRYSMLEAFEGLPTDGEEEAKLDLSRFAVGRELERLRPGMQSRRYFNLIRPDPDLPCPAVTATAGVLGAASVVAPFGRRKMTVAELKRICSFPDDFVLTGTYQQQVERLGRSVPPVMMRRVAEVVRDLLMSHRGGGGRDAD